MTDPVRLRALASAQGGVFLRSQALELGWRKAHIDTLVRSGTWQSCGYGALAVAADCDPGTAHARACWARLLRMSGDVVVSHASAAVLLGLPYVAAPARPTLTLAHLGQPLGRCGLLVSEVPPAHRTTTFGLSATTGARTLVDLLRTAPDALTAQGLADGSLREGVELSQVHDVLAYCAGWPGLRQARAALAFAEPRCESPLESWARVWFRRGGLPAPTPQYLVRDERGHVVGRVDFCFELFRVVVECDGQLKYRKGTSWSAAPSDTLWQEKLREDRVREQGYEVVRAYARDGGDGGADLCRRVRGAMARSASRASS